MSLERGKPVDAQWMRLLEWAFASNMPISNDQEKVQFFNALREEIQLRNLNMAECMMEFHWVLYNVAPSLADDFIRIYTPQRRSA